MKNVGPIMNWGRKILSPNSKEFLEYMLAHSKPTDSVVDWLEEDWYAINVCPLKITKKMKRFRVLSKIETILTVNVATSQLNDVVKSQIMGLMKDYAPEGKFSWFGSKLASDTKDFEVSKREYSNGLMTEFTLTKQCGSEIVEIQAPKEEEALFG